MAYDGSDSRVVVMPAACRARSPGEGVGGASGGDLPESASGSLRQYSIQPAPRRFEDG